MRRTKWPDGNGREVSRGDGTITAPAKIDWHKESKSPKVQEKQASYRNTAIEAEALGYPNLEKVCRVAMEGGIAYLSCLKTHLPGITGNGCSNKAKCIRKWARLYYRPKFRRRTKAGEQNESTDKVG